MGRNRREGKRLSQLRGENQSYQGAVVTRWFSAGSPGSSSPRTSSRRPLPTRRRFLLGVRSDRREPAPGLVVTDHRPHVRGGPGVGQGYVVTRDRRRGHAAVAVLLAAGAGSKRAAWSWRSSTRTSARTMTTTAAASGAPQRTQRRLMRPRRARAGRAARSDSGELMSSARPGDASADRSRGHTGRIAAATAAGAGGAAARRAPPGAPRPAGRAPRPSPRPVPAAPGEPCETAGGARRGSRSARWTGRTGPRGPGRGACPSSGTGRGRLPGPRPRLTPGRPASASRAGPKFPGPSGQLRRPVQEKSSEGPQAGLDEPGRAADVGGDQFAQLAGSAAPSRCLRRLSPWTRHSPSRARAAICGSGSSGVIPARAARTSAAAAAAWSVMSAW